MVQSEPHDVLPCGFRYEVQKTVTASDVYLWAGLAGQQLPVRSSAAFAQQAVMPHAVVPDAYLVGLIADTAGRLAACVPSLEAQLETLHVHFTAPVPVGTILRVVVTVDAWEPRATCTG